MKELRVQYKISVKITLIGTVKLETIEISMVRFIIIIIIFVYFR